jgi:hypothetical protein
MPVSFVMNFFQIVALPRRELQAYFEDQAANVNAGARAKIHVQGGRRRIWVICGRLDRRVGLHAAPSRFGSAKMDNGMIHAKIKPWGRKG